MAAEIELKPGWLLNDVRRAAERLDEWSSPAHRTRASGHAIRDQDSHRDKKATVAAIKKETTDR